MKHYICQDPPSEFEELNADQKRILLNWCDLITPIQSFNQKHTSYGLKHIFSNSLDGFYITNGQFKGAMLKLGFKVKDDTQLNWIFNVSERSIKWLVKENLINSKK